MDNYILKYNQYINEFNKYLETKLNSLSDTSPLTIREAMRYAIVEGGKRVRPVLCLALAECFGVPNEKVIDYALAIECIHAYSLVHDDLPSMDNDDYRRGKLSTHKKFGEAIGVLAGDALLNFAFEVCLSKDNISVNDIKAMQFIAKSAGYDGMIAGQVLDLENENSKQPNEETLYKIYYNKTAKLIIAPLMVVSCFVDRKFSDSINDYGYNLGVLFQIIDDILDVKGDVATIGKTPNKDVKAGKLTSIKLFGLDNAEELARSHYEKCLTALSKLPNNDFLLAFTKKLFERNK
ncbi:MAG: polyprenyl synthetase family protein [Clostridia bacterium]|nr:polyprenyl synthetase family protein [Clostridia bacterium]